MAKKYVLTNETKFCLGKTLHRIKAVRSFGDVCKGELGGWVESEENLSHEGNCWVYEEARVLDTAFVSDDARILHNAIAIDNSLLIGETNVCNNSLISENAIVKDASVGGYAIIGGHATLCGNTHVHDDAIIDGNACISGNADIGGNAFINNDDDHCGFDNIIPGTKHAHFYRTKHGDIEVCYDESIFRGNLEEFKKIASCTNEFDEVLYNAIMQVIKIKFNLN